MYCVGQYQGISFDYSYLLVWVAFYFTQNLLIPLFIYAPTSGVRKSCTFNNSNNNNNNNFIIIVIRNTLLRYANNNLTDSHTYRY